MFESKEKDSPRLEKDLMVCVDACKQGLGKVPDRAIGQIKVQRKHCGPEEATWEMETPCDWHIHFWFNFAKH